jgi:3-oxoacyl-(acyl-carrier-protein) synthase
MSKVVITGIGIVSALGTSTERFWEGLVSGADPLRRITRFETDPLAELWAAEVAEFEPPLPIRPKHPWTGNRSIQFAIAAAQQALADARIVLEDANRSDIGVVFGSTQSCLDLAVKVDLDGLLRGPRTVNPSLFPHSNPSAPSCRVSLELGLEAFNTVLSNGPTSGLDAITYAASAIRDRLAPVVLAGGLEELTRMTFLYHHSMECLAAQRARYAPFTSQGIMLGEGCAVLVLEDEHHARSRGANILAEVGGHASCFWPEEERTTRPSEGLEFAMGSALDTAMLRPKELNVIFAGANGDGCGDWLEADALRRIVPDVPVTAPKAQLGETHSAAGAFSAAACVLAMSRGVIPAAAPAERARSMVPSLVAEPVHGPVRAALVNCFSTSRSTRTYSSLALKQA